MKEYDNIEFEEINTGIDFEKMASKSDIDFEKEYDSLYDELLEKCHPNNFILYLRSDKEKFEIANDIYNDLMNNKPINDEELISLRNRAILELGIHISTRKLWNILIGYFEPTIYTNIVPYNKERVLKAGYYYTKIQEAKNDILALEDIEKEAGDFIRARRQEELQKKLEEERLNELQMEKYQNQKKETSKEMVSQDLFFCGGLVFAVFIAIIILTIINN